MMAVLCCLPLTAAITEFVALGPVHGGRGPHPTQNENNATDQASLATTLKWLQLDYEPTVSSAKDVKGKFVTSKPAELGHWFGLDLAKEGGES